MAHLSTANSGTVQAILGLLRVLGVAELDERQAAGLPVFDMHHWQLNKGCKGYTRTLMQRPGAPR